MHAGNNNIKVARTGCLDSLLHHVKGGKPFVATRDLADECVDECDDARKKGVLLKRRENGVLRQVREATNPTLRRLGKQSRHRLARVCRWVRIA